MKYILSKCLNIENQLEYKPLITPVQPSDWPGIFQKQLSLGRYKHATDLNYWVQVTWWIQGFNSLKFLLLTFVRKKCFSLSFMTHPIENQATVMRYQDFFWPNLDLFLVIFLKQHSVLRNFQPVNISAITPFFQAPILLLPENNKKIKEKQKCFHQQRMFGVYIKLSKLLFVGGWISFCHSPL